MKKIAILALLGVVSSQAMAFGPGVVSWTGGSRFASFYTSAQATPDMVGFQFSVNSAANLTHLGMWRDNDVNGLEQTHQVMLWRLGDGALLSQATVTNANPLTGDFHYAAVSPVTLQTGQTYVIAADYWSGGLDGYISTPTSAVYDSNITHIGAAHPAAVNMGYVMPTLVTTTNRGRFGPNFMTEAVPEPATMAVLGLGAAALLRRRKKS